MDQPLAGKVALITGATSGIGRASAIRFGAAGASVVVSGRDAARGAQVVAAIRGAGGDATFIRADASDPAEVERLVGAAEAWVGHLDIAYQSAGVMYSGTAQETPVTDFRAIIEVNLGGPFYLAKYAMPALERSGGGVLLLTASELGKVGAAQTVAYCAAKGGVINMVRALAIDGAPLRIRVVGLAPGPIDTPMLQAWVAGSDDPAAATVAQTQPVLLKRFGTADEMAEAALFLASSAASYMTGATLVVDGGATAWYGM